MSEVVKADEYLNGVVPGAAFVVHLEDPADIVNYTVEGNGTLFTVNSDLYITDATLTGVVSPDTTLSVIFNGTTLPVAATVAGGSGSTLLLVGYTQTGSTGSVTFSNKTLVGVAGTVLHDNKASDGSFRMTGTSTLSGMTFTGNSVTGSGGAFYAQNTWSIGESVFVNNLAPTYYGGAIHTNAASGTLKNVRFEGNTARNGGALNINSTTGAFSISGGTFIANHSGNTTGNAAGAGAIYMQSGALTVENSFFRANTLAESVTTRGGAIYIGSGTVGTVSISGSTFRDHVIAGRGGAIYNEKAAVFTVDKSLFSGNKGEYGAGIAHANAAGSCTITGSTFSGNTATAGGALANMFATMTVGASEDGTWTYFYNNSGQGALRNNGGTAVMTVGHVYFEGNTGGALYNFLGKVTINGELVLATAADTIGRQDSNSTYTIDCDEFLSDTTRIARVISTPAGAMSLKSMMTLDGGTLAYDVTSVDTANGLYIMQDGLTLTPIVSPAGDVFQTAIGGTTYYSIGYSALATAVTAATDTVILNGFTHSAGSYDPGKALTILGTDGAMFRDNSRNAYGGAMSLAYATTISGVTFANNQGTRGGAIRAQKDLTLTNVIFDSNVATAGLGSGVLADSSNTVTTIFGGSFLNGTGSGIYDAIDSVTVNAYGTIFADNAGGNNGGGIHHRGTANLYGVTFSQNSSSNGAAIYANNAAATVNIQAGTAGGKSVFAGNFGAAAIYSIGSLTVSDAMFLGNTSTSSASAIRNNGTAEISGSTFSGNTGTVAVRNDSAGTMTIGDVVFDGNLAGALNNQNAMTVNGLITLKTAADTMTNAGTITVDGSAFITGDALTVAKVIDAGTATNYGTVTVSGGDYRVFVADSDLYVTNAANVAAILTPAGTAMSATDYQGNVYVGAAYSTLAAALADSAGTVVMDDFTYSAGPFASSATGTILGGTNGALFRDNVSSGNGGAISNSGDLTLRGVTFSDSTAKRGGAINSSGTLTLTDVTFDGNVSSDMLGSALLTSGTTSIAGGAFLNGDGAAIYNNGATASLTITNALFSNNDGGQYNGAAVQNNTRLTVQGSTFADNACNNGTIYTNGTNGAVDISGSTFTGNLRGYAVNMLYGTMTVSNSKFDGNAYGGIYITEGTLTIRDSEFLTGADRVGVGAAAGLTLAGTNTLNANLSGSTVNMAENAALIFGNTSSIYVAGLTFGGSNVLTFSGSEKVNFTKTGGQDLSDAAITVDGSVYAGTPVTVATGVNAFDAYTVSGGDNLMLFTAGEDLILDEVSNQMTGGTTANFFGGTSNLMTGGVVEVAFFGTTQTSGDVRTVFTGGTVVNSMIGGVLVQKGNSAAFGTVTVSILDGVSLLGGPSNGGMNYVAGYAYGANGAYDLDTTPTLGVTQSTLNFSGSEISGNFYAGAHARRGAYADVDETIVTVTGGYIEKLYGGGWAERGDKTYTIEGGTAARSDVGTATVTISGGTVERLYAGGGNAFGGYTDVGTANLTISGGQVDFVFLGGRNINSSVGDATLTITGSSAQTLTRISGRNDCGADRTTGTTTLNVDTFVTLDYLDYVDQINISEGNRLHIVEDVIYTNGNGLAVDLETDGFDGVWTLFSATDAADINTLAEARFYFNGGTTSYTMGDTMTIGGGTYSLNKSGLSIALSKN